MIKSPRENYSGFSSPGWRTSSINEKEGCRFPDFQISRIRVRAACVQENVDSRGQRDNGTLFSVHFSMNQGSSGSLLLSSGSAAGQWKNIFLPFAISWVHFLIISVKGCTFFSLLEN